MSDDFMVKYTNRDIMDKLQEQDKTLTKILNHAKLTNGRVNILEKTSLGMMIRKHPIKFASAVALSLLVMVDSLRDIALSILTKLI